MSISSASAGAHDLELAAITNWSKTLAFSHSSDGMILQVVNRDGVSLNKWEAKNGTLTCTAPNVTGTLYLHQGSVSVTSDGVKTYKQLLEELVAKTDFNKFTIYSNLVIGGNYYRASVNFSAYKVFTQTMGSTNSVLSHAFYFSRDTTQSPNAFVKWELKNTGNTCTDLSNTAPNAGTSIYIYY